MFLLFKSSTYHQLFHIIINILLLPSPIKKPSFSSTSLHLQSTSLLFLAHHLVPTSPPSCRSYSSFLSRSPFHHFPFLFLLVLLRSFIPNFPMLSLLPPPIPLASTSLLASFLPAYLNYLPLFPIFSLSPPYPPPPSLFSLPLFLMI